MATLPHALPTRARRPTTLHVPLSRPSCSVAPRPYRHVTAQWRRGQPGRCPLVCAAAASESSLHRAGLQTLRQQRAGARDRRTARVARRGGGLLWVWVWVRLGVLPARTQTLAATCEPRTTRQLGLTCAAMRPGNEHWLCSCGFQSRTTKSWGCLRRPATRTSSRRTGRRRSSCTQTSTRRWVRGRTCPRGGGWRWGHVHSSGGPGMGPRVGGRWPGHQGTLRSSVFANVV